MCVIYVAFGQHRDHPLIVLANRDEYYSRPSAAAEFWSEHPFVYAGRDLRAGGTWLGVTRSGRFSAVTNFRDPSAACGPRSRGNLVLDFLTSEESPREYLARVETEKAEYSGFNLLAGEIGTRRELFYYSNRANGVLEMTPGIYGLSNHLLDTPWRKVERGKARFRELLKSTEIPDHELLDILSDESVASDGDLPATGISYERERALSAICIKTPDYGTRCSTIVRFNNDHTWSFSERVFV